MLRHKFCASCGIQFAWPIACSPSEWSARIVCSVRCAAKLPKRPLSVRFWEKVRRGSEYECWQWAGSTDGHGYGQISDKSRGQSPQKAYRISWELHFGDIPPGKVVRHKCDNSICVNPRHLELGTQADNVRDRVVRGRTSAAQLANLRPGAPGFYGAGPRSRKDIANGVS